MSQEPWRSWDESTREEYREHLRSMGVPQDTIDRCYRTKVEGDRLKLSVWHQTSELGTHVERECQGEPRFTWWPEPFPGVCSETLYA